MKFFNIEDFKRYLKAESEDSATIEKLSNYVVDFLTYRKRKPHMPLSEFNKKIDKQLYDATFYKPDFKNCYSIKLTSSKYFSWKNIKYKLQLMFEKLEKSLGSFEYFVWTYAISDIEFEVYICLSFKNHISRTTLYDEISYQWYYLDKCNIIRVYEITQLLSFLVKLKDKVNFNSKDETTSYLKSSKLFMISRNFANLNPPTSKNKIPVFEVKS